MEDFTYKCENCCACCMFWNPARYDPNIVNDLGICKHLDLQNKKCLIYENRPIFCRVNEWYHIICKENYIEYDKFIRQVKMGCDILKKMEGESYEILLVSSLASQSSKES